MSNLVRRLTYGVILLVLAAYIVAAQRGPQGIPALLETRRKIRAMEEENANLARKIAAEREEVRKLRKSRSAQESQIRKDWDLQRKGDVTLMLPERPSKPAPASTMP